MNINLSKLSYCSTCILAFSVLFPTLASGQELLNQGWKLSVAGQSALSTDAGGFLIPNITTPDQFGENGTGTVPDFISDDFVRLTGHKIENGRARYVWSQPFQIRNREAYLIQDEDLTFSDNPLQEPEFIRLTSPRLNLTTIGETAQLTTIALFADSTPVLTDNPSEDVTPRSKFTVYRSSNPEIITVSKDGLVTAGRGEGEVIVSAVNSMVSSSLKFQVSTIPRTTVEGIVRFSDGRPAAGASVQLIPQTSLTTTTDSQGRFTIQNVAADAGTISARVSELASGLVALLPNAEPIRNAITDLGIGILGLRTQGFEPFGSKIEFSDDDPKVFALGNFRFPLFGDEVSGEFELSPNGVLFFNGSSNGDGYQNFAFPSNGRTLIAPFFDDVDPSQGGEVGIFQSQDFLAVTWELVPYFGRRDNNVSFQVVIRSTGVIEFRYAGMTTPPGGTADEGASIDTASIGMAKGNIAVVPVAGRIANRESTFEITNPAGFLNATGLAVLDERKGEGEAGVDVLKFTPTGSGSYDIGFNVR